MSTGVNWGIGIGAEGSASITAGFEATWSTTETWSRSNRQEITEVSITYLHRVLYLMAIRVVEFLRGGYKIGKIVA